MTRHRARPKRRGASFTQDQYWQSAAYNQMLFQSFRDRLMSLALARFKWEGLPKTCDARYLEWCLLVQGCATVARRGESGFWLSLQATPDGPPNMYSRPTSWHALGDNGTMFHVKPSNGVFIYDNMTRYPLMSHLDIWARELTDLMRTKQLNRMHQRIPFILTGPQEKYFDMVNLYKQIAGGEPAVLATDGISAIGVEALQTGVPYIGEQLQAEMLNVWSQVYTVLGIPNLPFKAERQIADELADLGAATDVNALSALECRRQAAEMLNARFGDELGPVTVHMNSDYQSANSLYSHSLARQAEDGTALAALLNAREGGADAG